MLFIQKIEIKYYKNLKFPNFAVQRESLNFLPIPAEPKEFRNGKMQIYVPENKDVFDCEVFLQTEKLFQYPDRFHSSMSYCRQFGEEIFTEGSRSFDKNFHELIEFIRIFKEENGYKIMFCDDSSYYSVKRQGHNESYNDIHSPMSYTNRLYETAFFLKDGEYGRIIFNNRFVEHDTGKWVYIRTVYNCLNCDRAAFREKMFFRKKPDFEYTSLEHLF